MVFHSLSTSLICNQTLQKCEFFFIIQWYFKVCQCDEFLSLDRNAAAEVLSRDQLTVKCEDQVNMTENDHHLSSFFISLWPDVPLKQTRGQKIPILVVSSLCHVGV